MRDIIDLFDSYTNDDESLDASYIGSEYVDTHGFEEENRQLKSYFKVKSKAAQKAILDYTTESPINNLLNRVLDGDPTKLPLKYRKQYGLLTGLHGVLKEEHHVYSGTGTFDATEKLENNLFKTTSFISASLNIKIAAMTANFRRDGTDDNLMHFILPKGFDGGFYIAEYSYDPEELEYLIFPNEKFQYIESKKLEISGITRHIHVFKPL